MRPYVTCRSSEPAMQRRVTLPEYRVETATPGLQDEPPRAVHLLRLGGVSLLVSRIWLVVPLMMAIFAAPDQPSVTTRLLFGLQPLLWALSVIGHEVGHALMARRFGVGVWAIALLPAGGATVLDGAPQPETQQMWVSAAGPLAN